MSFADRATRVTPFEHQGKTAVRAYVYECETDGKRFVHYVERYTDAVRPKLEEAAAKGAPPQALAGMAGMGGAEVKRPGDAEWVNRGNLAVASKITAPTCAHGGKDVFEVVPE